MGWGRVKTPRNINLFAYFYVSVPAEPAAAGEPAEGCKSSVFRNGLEQSEDSIRIPRMARNAPNRYESHYFFNLSIAYWHLVFYRFWTQEPVETGFSSGYSP